MNDMVLAATVRTQLAIQSMIGKLRQERGASALEYVGMLLVGAVIVATVYHAISQDKIKAWIDNVTKVLDGIHE